MVVAVEVGAAVAVKYTPVTKTILLGSEPVYLLAFASRSVLTFLTQPLPPSVRGPSQTTNSGVDLCWLG